MPVEFIQNFKQVSGQRLVLQALYHGGGRRKVRRLRFKYGGKAAPPSASGLGCRCCLGTTGGPQKCLGSAVATLAGWLASVAANHKMAAMPKWQDAKMVAMTATLA